MKSALFALTSDEGPAYWFLNTLTVIRAAASQTGGSFGLVEQFAPVGAGSPYHVHHREEESFYVLEGRLEFVSGGRWITGLPGSYIFLPRDVPHGFRVAGAAPARFLIMTTPGGFEQFIIEMGEPAAARRLPAPTAPDIPRLTAVAARYGIDILGPLPD